MQRMAHFRTLSCDKFVADPMVQSIHWLHSELITCSAYARPHMPSNLVPHIATTRHASADDQCMYVHACDCACVCANRVCTMFTSCRNEILLCDGEGCDVAVHQACYAVARVPRGKWYCDACKDKLDLAKPNCVCCPVVGGALRKVCNSHALSACASRCDTSAGNG